MKVGDLVARAYAWPELVSGIIVEEHEDTMKVENHPTDVWKYNEITFDIAWSDGSMSTEMLEELEFLKDVIDEDQ